ncbi:MAG TPA: aspartate/glutamate racemase family protein [Gammaproteobacteria bacterium]|jgi:aspartate racemase|nr:aspartate/glutamate racemase family protein [Gammaproteobacteria bacterium]HIN89778.1 aspartate/glutamate racemase family protein [Porticoccaceae bacterium]
MKTIGMLGGMSWESTATYYRILNEGIKSALGGFHSARIAMVSVDFDEMEKLQHTGDWEQMARLLGAAAKSVEAAGADFLLICTNTMHKVAPQIEQAISIPLLHIADATAEQLVRDRISCVGLLGTQFTMEQDFYKRRLTEKFGIKVVIPDAGDRELVHEVIYDELCMGKITVNSRSSYLHIIDKLKQHGAEAVVLGCTEIALLVQQAHTPVPLYDTTEIHAQQAIRYALAD